MLKEMNRGPRSHPREAQALVARATDPRQYDAPDLHWSLEGVITAPFARFVHETLRRALGDLAGKSVLDIGSGTGHLFPLLRELGAARVVGLEPSSRNAEHARRDHPGLELIEAPLEEAPANPTFDVAVAVMSFEHQPDLAVAFRAVRAQLAPGGRFHLIHADREFQMQPRFGLRVDAYELGGGAAVVATHYPYGTLHDLVWPAARFRSAARSAGFEILHHQKLPPSRELIAADPLWGEFAGRPVAHLLAAGA